MSCWVQIVRATFVVFVLMWLLILTVHLRNERVRLGYRLGKVESEAGRAQQELRDMSREFLRQVQAERLAEHGDAWFPDMRAADGRGGRPGVRGVQAR